MNRIAFLSACLWIVSPVFASAGQDRGGGDLCENRIQTIAKDIDGWILKYGHESLALPVGSYSNYAHSMRNAISRAGIRCVSPGDRGYPVEIDRVPKVCTWARTRGTATIACDAAKFQALSESEQYVLIHHEYAGIADLETPNGAASNYQISNQISEYLVDQVVKKLAVKNSQSAVSKSHKIGFLLDSGYALKATVTKEIGIALPPDDYRPLVSGNCYLQVIRSPIARLIPRGRTFIITGPDIGWYRLLVQDKTVTSINLYRDSLLEHSVDDLERSCQGISFEIVENSYLQHD